ncbi:NAD-glutamate dehydrogenase [Amycolatopsis cynarae]|uniref:NAD-glutamate dehydrogenase n=1 Tax=Amycolatopsis cynarae TaxID=2995223 RepID=A0ABY7B2I3_9PSEU|nr:NAD-glutamate dehydrogenase [Amycolatopsis sp. HUAS 11-8]WAL66510.1 NAD-glutamate dehydrogenase [Amycolatopsis sp. HUAS 11-8]
MTLTQGLSIADTEGDRLAGVYSRGLPAEERAAAGEDELAALLGSHRALARQRTPAEPVLRIFTRSLSRDGRTQAVTAIQVVTDDMPCLVDSVLDELARGGARVRRVVHPIVVARRNGTGELIEVLPDADPEEPPAGAITESWISVEVDRIAGPAEAEELRRRLHTVLADVREVFESGERMREIAMAVATETADAETAALLRWLADGNFLFLGYRFDEISGPVPESRTGLGLLRREDSLLAGLDTTEPGAALPPLELAAASGSSTVHGPDAPFHVGVAAFGADGQARGRHRFVGAFTGSARHEDVSAIPVIAGRVRRAISHAGVPLDSRSGRRMLNILQDLPRGELFSADWRFLHAAATGLLVPTERHRLRLFVRRDPYLRFFSCLVHLGTDHCTTATRAAMGDVLLDELRGTSVEQQPCSATATMTTIRFVVHTDPAAEADTDIDTARIQERLSATVRGWDDQLIEAVLAGADDPAAGAVTAELARRYADAFPPAYKEDFDARVGLTDLRRLRDLSGEGDLAVSLYLPPGASAGEAGFKLYLSGRRITLSAVLPMLQHLGVEVVDERPYEISWDGTERRVFDFGLTIDRAGGWQDPRARERFEDAFTAVWRGDAESDRFNALVPYAGLTWRQAALLRAYAAYLRQAGTRYSQSYLQETLIAHPGTVVALVRLFEARFDPALPEPERPQRTDELTGEVERLIDEVSTLDADRILRGYLALINATVRTSYFRSPVPGAADPVLTLKLDPQAVPGLPQPRPHRETFVYSPRVEGVHLRYGPVARGGLRWSDRREDYRTEILGLVKAQAAKNAVIVPVGAKGGFVLKRPPSGNREALAAEALACYRMFVSGLLDVTDNVVRGRTVPPARVVRHDGDDTYLVVAADKGTATFSDAANEVAASHGFWLGDAFASGGSVGYDHKAMGITARGAWESVRRNFRELGLDPDRDDFTVVGIGDMSGDVFGNGMLLSRHIRLVAAFDHRHVFLDPEPDAERSFAERQRLFRLPRSSWADYDRSLLSAGGGVWPRDVKAIPLNDHVRAALGLGDLPGPLSPAELVKAILLAPVDLLWNGGIGTYVKGTAESHAEVRDKANDAVRVDGNELRARVVAEGGNLGLTQQGRIEFARAGGKVNTDALDNSAGVDCSDHEVNIKIMLDLAVAKAALSGADRNARLSALTDDVADLVLANNRRQNRVLGVSRSHATAMLPVHARLIADLERRHGLDRRLEVLPAPGQLAAMEREGQGLSSPELATLLAHVKLGLKKDILASDLLDEEVFTRRVPTYFPQPLRQRFGGSIRRHPLRREIEATLLVNEVVDNAGLSYTFRLAEEMAVEPADAVRAFTVVSAVYDLAALWQQIDTDGTEGAGLPTETTDGLLLETRRLLDRASRWMLRRRPQPLDVGTEIERFRPVVGRLAARLNTLVRGRVRADLEQGAQRLLADGVPEALAGRIPGLLAAYPLLDIAEVTERIEGGSAEETAELYYALSDHLGVDRLLEAVGALPHGDRWHALARLSLRDDLYDSLRAITFAIAAGAAPGRTADQHIAAWEHAEAARLARVRRALAEIGESGRADLPAVTAAVNQIRALAG